MGDTLFHRCLFRSMLFLRLVTVSVIVLSLATNFHHFHVKWFSDLQGEANPSHGTVISIVDGKGTVWRESQVYIPCLIRSSVMKFFSGEFAEVYPVRNTEFLSKLTHFVSFMVVSEGHCFVVFRWLIQILLDLLMKQRPPRKPIWNQPKTEDIGDAIRRRTRRSNHQLVWVHGGVCRSTQEECVDRHKSGTETNRTVGVSFFLALMLVDDENMMRIRRSSQQHVWVYGTITITHISFFKRVPKSIVLRCNGWIVDFDFRKRKRWYIDKQQMFPKLESHTRLKDKTRAIKYIFRIAALNLLCFFVTEIFDCIYILMCIITIFGSY